MEYPTINVKQKSRQMADAFMGYNHNLRIGDSEFYDMKNMTSDYYPVMSPRKQRGIYYKKGTVISLPANALIAKHNNLCFAQGTRLVIDGRPMEAGLRDDITGDKQLISMGAYVIVMPDKKWIKIDNVNAGVSAYGNIEAEFDSGLRRNDVSFQMCTITGDAYGDATLSSSAPTSPKNNQLWIDTSSVPHTLKKYSTSSASWVSVPSTYVKISCNLIDKQFNQYDGVTISGITVDGASGLNGSHVLWGCGDGYVIVSGILDKACTQTYAQGPIKVERKMPDMDFVIESNNRLWGCKYGKDENGNMINEIYASKQGDFKNWNCFMNLSTDSYVASCGSDGPFTGAITHMGYPLFFKENCMHKVYGDYPSNFQVQHTTCRGVQEGSHKSLSVVNETLFYKSRAAVCAYDGSLPVEISSALGNVSYRDARACAHGNKYYINMKTEDDVYHLFAYDTAKGMWHKEDNIRLRDLCSLNGELYAIEHDTDDVITLMGPGPMGVMDGEDKVKWMVESGLVGMNMPDMKYISRLQVRMSLDVGSVVEVSIQYDSVGDWEQVCRMSVTSLRSFSIPVRLKRCDHFRIRIEGEGEGKIYSITKTIEQGSDVT